MRCWVYFQITHRIGVKDRRSWIDHPCTSKFRNSLSQTQADIKALAGESFEFGYHSPIWMRDIFQPSHVAIETYSALETFMTSVYSMPKPKGLNRLTRAL